MMKFITLKDILGTIGSIAVGSFFALVGAFFLDKIGAIIGFIIGFSAGAIATGNWKRPKNR